MKMLVATMLALLVITPELLLAQPVKKGQFLIFEGEGKADPSIQNVTQRRSLSQGAAILDAKSKIAFYIDELKTKDQVPIKIEKEKNKAVEKKVKMFLQGVEAVQSRWDEQDHCFVLVKIHKKVLFKKLKAHE